MQETTLTWPTPDGKMIYGVRSGDITKPAIIIVHGLTGHMYEYQFKRAAELWRNDYCVYRFNLYGGENAARDLIDCTLQTHADDFTCVVNTIAKDHAKVFAVGHSYGGPTIMLANNASLSAVSLWDPSYDLTFAEELFEQPFATTPDIYAVNWGTVQLIGKPMRDHALLLDVAACKGLSQVARYPIQVVMAGNGTYVTKGASYDTDCPHAHRRDVVAGTEHCFYEHDTADTAAGLTADWFNQWL